MRKMFLLLIGVGLFIVATPASAYAIPATTVVGGQVTHQGNIVSGASVTVTCNGNVRSTSSNDRGKYAVTYSEPDCPIGKIAKAVATKGSMNGTDSDVVNSTDVDGLNIAILNIAVPEFGVITGLVGLIAAGGILVFVRRRRGAEVENS